MLPLLFAALAALELGCGGSQPGPRAVGTPGAAGHASAPSPFAGLRPCSKDDAGESCAKPGAHAHADSTADTVWNVPVGPDDPVRGPRDALVTVVVFSDFECPFCKHTSGELAKLREALGPELRIVWKDCPGSAHARALPAAEFARAVRAALGDEGFWRAHDRLYASQGELGEPLFRKIAAELGADWPAIRAALQGTKYGAVIRADLVLADRVDVTATPTTYVNGKRIVGAQPYSAFEELARKELAQAKRLVASGAPRERLYERIIQEGKQVSPPTDAPE